jgi:hypothetical protein
MSPRPFPLGDRFCYFSFQSPVSLVVNDNQLFTRVMDSKSLNLNSGRIVHPALHLNPEVRAIRQPNPEIRGIRLDPTLHRESEDLRLVLPRLNITSHDKDIHEPSEISLPARPQINTKILADTLNPARMRVVPVRLSLRRRLFLLVLSPERMIALIGAKL